MGKARPSTSLDMLAEQIADVLNGIAPKLPIKPEDVDLRILAELYWALGLEPTIAFRQILPNTAPEQKP